MAPPPQEFNPPGHILSQIRAGQRTERYGRTWIIGRTEYRDDRGLFGRIGYQASGGTVELWNEDRRDFVDVAVPGGFATPFLINLRTLRLAFQPRPPQIKIGAVVGAFQGTTQHGRRVVVDLQCRPPGAVGRVATAGDQSDACADAAAPTEPAL